MKRFAIEEDRSVPGTIDCRYSNKPDNLPAVINMFAQWELGPAERHRRIQCPAKYGIDSRENRELWFQQCLDAIAAMSDYRPRSIAFPNQIGCNLAGGHWAKYEAMIKRFASQNPDILVMIITQQKVGGDAP